MFEIKVGAPRYSRQSCRLLITIANQINCSSAFKRFANASQVDVAKIHEDTHEKATKDSICWAVNVLVGKTDLLHRRERLASCTPPPRAASAYDVATTLYYIRILSKLHYQNSYKVVQDRMVGEFMLEKLLYVGLVVL